MAERTGLAIGREERDGAIILKPEGDVDMSCSPALRDAIRRAQDARPKRLVIDLSAVEYMDSSGLATLVEAMKVARGQKAALVLCNMSAKVRAIFEIARLHHYFTITGTVEDAMIG
ncbi:MAG: anti-sigma factor antagonist [Leptolyngbya sp. PLA2]|nr:anti-sigma factor antagonist [Leptolyngbya sp.]MCE7972254.1 anti-sigma factor antagonist [Leptolyngbya sp. PL-A2]MCQ3941166.1 anti-sigma factor antagonist [cyanobacterium CYA1]MCZ7633235.1 STAS domain-containing protein [Phycisphaerales bacterium]GIK18290.1 MAG: putative anti-sigma factor antagonist [Planctomycetota bacterium]